MTLRSFLTGLVLLAAAAVAITYNDYEYSNGYLSGGNHFPIIAVFVIVLFSLALNPLLRLFKPEWTFTQSEIIVIWCMIAVGIGIPASGLMRYLMPFMVAPFYFTEAEGKWVTTFHQLVPDWLVPSKDVNSTIVRWFYEGRGKNPLPWEAWVTPFFAWAIVLMAAYLMMFCLTAIIRKQWVEHERLTFPLAQIPLEISRPPQQGHYLNALFRSPIMWLGAGLPIFFWTLAGLNNFYPNVPYINSISWTLTGLFGKMTGWQGMVRFYFMPIGVAFLLSTEVSLSLWFFFFLHNAQRIIRNKFGYAGVEFEPRQQVGAFFTFAVIGLWTMRHHLKDVLRKAFLGAGDVDDSRESLSYRTAVFGLIIASAVIVGWLYVIGCPPWISLFFLSIVVVILLVLSRLVAQCGLLLVQANFRALDLMQDLVGDKAITPSGMTALTFHQASLYGDTREVMMPTLLNNAKMGENRVNLRKLFLAMMVAVVVSYSVSYIPQVRRYYRFGAGTVMPNYAPEGYPRSQLDRLASAIDDPKGAFAKGAELEHVLVGGAAVGLVYFLRSRLTWWFVHPIGILTAATYPMQNLWLSIMIGWLCKSLAQRYARGPMMATIKRFFLGIIIGDALITIIWAVVGLILGESVGVSTSVS